MTGQSTARKEGKPAWKPQAWYKGKGGAGAGRDPKAMEFAEGHGRGPLGWGCSVPGVQGRAGWVGEGTAEPPGKMSMEEAWSSFYWEHFIKVPECKLGLKGKAMSHGRLGSGPAGAGSLFPAFPMMAETEIECKSVGKGDGGWVSSN